MIQRARARRQAANRGGEESPREATETQAAEPRAKELVELEVATAADGTGRLVPRGRRLAPGGEPSHWLDSWSRLIPDWREGKGLAEPLLASPSTLRALAPEDVGMAVKLTGCPCQERGCPALWMLLLSVQANELLVELRREEGMIRHRSSPERLIASLRLPDDRESWELPEAIEESSAELAEHEPLNAALGTAAWLLAGWPTNHARGERPAVRWQGSDLEGEGWKMQPLKASDLPPGILPPWGAARLCRPGQAAQVVTLREAASLIVEAAARKGMEAADILAI